jgi:hypothetical protein
MKTAILGRIAFCAIALSSLVIACKKDSAGNSNANTIQTQADDQAMVSNESDLMANDVNTAIGSNASFNGNSAADLRNGQTTLNSVDQTKTLGEGNALICDATIVFDSSANSITITYNGTNCYGNRTRKGTVTIALTSGAHWMDEGAVATVTVQNLVITRMSDHKSITINGTRTITNVSGGSLNDLANDGSITHALSDNFSITFSDQAVRSWMMSKTRVFTYNNGIVITSTGTHSDGVYNNIAEWGTNRFGTDFESLISVPKVIRQDCEFRLVSGQNIILRSDSLNSTITYGLDAMGNPTSCPSGNYYLEVVWSYHNLQTSPIILAY